MAEALSKAAKTAIMKDIILRLHQLPVDEAKARFEREIGDTTSTEMARDQASLNRGGLTAGRDQAVLQRPRLALPVGAREGHLQETSPSHPVFLFKLENAEIGSSSPSLRETDRRAPQSGFAPFKDGGQEAVAPL